MSNLLPGSIRELKKQVTESLNAGDINHALRLIHNRVEKIITEPSCTAQAFASKELDSLCQQIGNQSLISLKNSRHVTYASQDNPPKVAYLLSRWQKTGGHSRLVSDFISAQPDKEHIIYITGIGGPSDLKYLKKNLNKKIHVQIVSAPRGNFQERLFWLQSELANCGAGHVYLFNHHQDSVAVSALVPDLGISGTFCHHGDHHLCLGVHLRHLSHMDFHPMGYHYCREKLGIDNVYLPLTFEDKGITPNSTKSLTPSGGLRTATAAGTNKIEIPYHVSYLEIVPKILKITGGTHLHIGRLTPWALRHLRRQMRQQQIPADKLIYIPWTPSVWKTLQEYEIDVYLASFPYGAGLTLIEVMGAGVPVLMHQHMYSRVLSGLEIAYPEAFSWASPDALLNYITNLKPEKLEQEGQAARLHYEKYHRPEILKEQLNSTNKIQITAPALNQEFKLQYDEWAAWQEAQITLPHLIRRFLHRAARRIRRILS